jgi:hypothetical protein
MDVDGDRQSQKPNVRQMGVNTNVEKTQQVPFGMELTTMGVSSQDGIKAFRKFFRCPVDKPKTSSAARISISSRYMLMG